MLITNLELDDSIKTACVKAKLFDIDTLFTYTFEGLVTLLQLVDTDVKQLTKVAAEALVANRSASAYDIFKNNVIGKDLQSYKLSTGCKEIDTILNGGLVYPGVNEICGESASGKTQLCMQLCLMCKYPNGQPNRGSLYICTEDVFPTKRLQQMSQRFYERNKAKLCFQSLHEVTDDIFIEHVVDIDDLWTLINARIESLLENSSIKLIIIDSVAALFRAEFEYQDMAERAKLLAKLGQRLHALSFKYKLCIVTVNQVSDVFDGTSSIVNMDGTRNVAPTLGFTWSYVVNTRLMLARTKWTVENSNKIKMASNKVANIQSNIRKLKILFSPHLKEDQCYFIVDEDGVKGYKTPQAESTSKTPQVESASKTPQVESRKEK